MHSESAAIARVLECDLGIEKEGIGARVARVGSRLRLKSTERCNKQDTERNKVKGVELNMQEGWFEWVCKKNSEFLKIGHRGERASGGSE
jgi:hypothetical protein